jgi:hypothetical protein
LGKFSSPSSKCGLTHSALLGVTLALLVTGSASDFVTSTETDIIHKEGKIYIWTMLLSEFISKASVNIGSVNSKFTNTPAFTSGHYNHAAKYKANHIISDCQRILLDYP